MNFQHNQMVAKEYIIESYQVRALEGAFWVPSFWFLQKVSLENGVSQIPWINHWYLFISEVSIGFFFFFFFLSSS